MHILLVNHKSVRLAEPWKATQICHPYTYIYNEMTFAVYIWPLFLHSVILRL